MELLEKYFEIAAEAQNGIKQMRELILKLAMQGKLVSQSNDDSVTGKLLLEDIQEEKNRLIKNKLLKEQKTVTKIKKEELIYSVPDNWEWCRLGQISEYIQRGKGPEYSDIREIPVISQKCVQWSGFNREVVKFINPNTINKYSEERFIKCGDLLWNSTGTGTLGRINMYDNQLSNFAFVVADSHVTVVRPLLVNNKFLLYFLSSPIVQNDIEKNASGSTNQIELNTSTINNQLIPLPPLEEQKRIVDKIEQLMVLCEQLEEQKKIKSDLQTQILNAVSANF